MSRIPTVKIPAKNGATFVNGRVISTAPCKLLSLLIYNSSAAAQFIQVHETNAVPADAAVPALPSVSIGAGQTLMFDFGVNGVDLDALSVCNSSTADVKTIGAADCSIVAVLRG